MFSEARHELDRRLYNLPERRWRPRFSLRIVPFGTIAALATGVLVSQLFGETYPRLEVSVAIGGLFGTVLALIFTLSLATAQRAAEAYKPSILRLYGRDPILWVIFGILSFCIIASFGTSGVAKEDMKLVADVLDIHIVAYWPPLLHFLLIGVSIDAIASFFRRALSLLDAHQATQTLVAYAIARVKSVRKSLGNGGKRHCDRKFRNEFIPLVRNLMRWCDDLTEMAVRSLKSDDESAAIEIISGLGRIVNEIDALEGQVAGLHIDDYWLRQVHDASLLGALLETMQRLYGEALSVRAFHAAATIVQILKDILDRAVKTDETLTGELIDQLLGCAAETLAVPGSDSLGADTVRKVTNCIDTNLPPAVTNAIIRRIIDGVVGIVRQGLQADRALAFEAAHHLSSELHNLLWGRGVPEGRYLLSTAIGALAGLLPVAAERGDKLQWLPPFSPAFPELAILPEVAFNVEKVLGRDAEEGRRTVCFDLLGALSEIAKAVPSGNTWIASAIMANLEELAEVMLDAGARHEAEACVSVALTALESMASSEASDLWLREHILAEGYFGLRMVAVGEWYDALKIAGKLAEWGKRVAATPDPDPRVLGLIGLALRFIRQGLIYASLPQEILAKVTTHITELTTDTAPIAGASWFVQRWWPEIKQSPDKRSQEFNFMFRPRQYDPIAMLDQLVVRHAGQAADVPVDG